MVTAGDLLNCDGRYVEVITEDGDTLRGYLHYTMDDCPVTIWHNSCCDMTKLALEDVVSITC